MNYTKADLRKFFLAGRRFGLTENEEKTTMDFNKFFGVYSEIQEDIKEDQEDHLTDLMEISQKAGLYEDFPKTDFLGRPADKIFTEVDIADAIYMSKVRDLSTHQIIEKLKDRKWPKK